MRKLIARVPSAVYNDLDIVLFQVREDEWVTGEMRKEQDTSESWVHGHYYTEYDRAVVDLAARTTRQEPIMMAKKAMNKKVRMPTIIIQCEDRDDGECVLEYMNEIDNEYSLGVFEIWSNVEVEA